MIRGTTPTHIFTLPLDTDQLDEVMILYAQSDTVLLKKTTAECTMEGKTVRTTLTQEDTFLFDCTKPVQIQVRVLTLGGEALASTIQTIAVGKCLGGGVLR